ncbi:MAG TPA: DNA-binding protein [Pirellulales bacterium]|nr:DNA-binding protein [Pirellulales bacterium]
MAETSQVAFESPPAPRVASPRAEAMLVVDLGAGQGADFARRVGAGYLDERSFAAASDQAELRKIVLFLSGSAPCPSPKVTERLGALAEANRDLRLCVVSSYRAHFGDTRVLAAERSISERLHRATTARVTILRPGNVVGVGSPLETRLRWLGALYPLVPSRLRSCFLDVEELLGVIDNVTGANQARRRRVISILGPNRALRDVLAQRRPSGTFSWLVTFVAQVLAWLCVGRLLGLAFSVAARMHRPLRCWQFDTLTPASTDELLALYNPYNYRYVAVAGYNTGVVHFGWEWPGRTVVKTVGSGHVVRLRGDSVVVDAGLTLKRTVEVLRRLGRELCVVPNYSYISMGTTFFVPVHGSACDVSTLGETIEKVWLYDPKSDRLVVVRRSDPRFVDAMYRPASGMLALRLQLRVQTRRRFVVEHTTLDSPTASEVWELLGDRSAANIELRKSRAGDSQVDVRKYYPASAADEAVLDAAQDSVGRLWDKLEENALTSYAFHTLIRRFGFHVELFLDEREFAVFWNAHRGLPLSKIQLRYVRADHLPHSPCGDRDCASADLFMLRSKSAAFLNFVREHLPHARFNPGKHSARLPAR